MSHSSVIHSITPSLSRIHHRKLRYFNENNYDKTVYSNSFINSNFSLKESKIINKSKIKNRYTERKLSKYFFEGNFYI